MADVRPFRAFHFPFSLGSDYADVIAPPYDVIGPEKERELLARHKHNAVRITLADPSKREAKVGDEYTEAAKTLKQWMASAVLAQDPEPAIYVLEDTFDWEWTERRRRGLLLTVRLEELGKGSILPHEKTLAAPIRDREQLMRATGMHESPVYMTFADRANAVRGKIDEIVNHPPLLHCENKDVPLEHRLWCVRDPQWIADVQDLLNREPFLIADGHHRYQTALHHARTEGAKSDEAQWMLALLAPSPDAGVVLSAYHRIVDGGIAADEMIRKLSASFDVTRSPITWGAFDAGSSPIAAILPGVNELLHLTPRKTALKDIPHDLKSVPSCLLNDLILGAALGIDLARPEDQKRIRYDNDPEGAHRTAVKSNAACFWLKPLAVERVIEIAKAGFVLPQKSTYFYPKVMSGFAFQGI